MVVILEANKVPDKAQYAHIINNAGNKSWNHCALNKDKCNKQKPGGVFEVFTNSMEKSDSYWKYSDMYLSNVYQDYNEPAAELAIRVEEIM